MPRLLKISVSLILGALSYACNASEKIDVIYPRPVTSDDQRTAYPSKLLALGLEKSGAPFHLTSSNNVMLQGRALKMLAAGEQVNVVWSMTSNERETDLQPIRIPIYKGLIGWRLPLVNDDRVIFFQTVESLAQLKLLTAGQGHDWPDTAILRQNGFKVLGVASYEGLFRMLSLHRFDYFPRSIVEIWAEAKNHAQRGIVVESSIIIKYPTAFYYFVNKKDRDLAYLLNKGLNIAIEDGSFDKLFLEYHQPLLERAKLKKRKVFEIDNPILPKETPLDDKRLWLDINAYSQNN
ncbi:substrate-binding periplasmic protein [Zooshikella harenae]|uniref:Solute-binding protein family 3/N-terminal domain-containing protein n=1 Tax=Zooshikella harenae TaxID=2827238 RepID=A0ABS5Z664_9GAMM|nr:hypothetical protein [Zooshikella harenae]MBU2709534.1 hypothetical protein [Zooshikella harenae]